MSINSGTVIEIALSVVVLSFSSFDEAQRKSQYLLTVKEEVIPLPDDFEDIWSHDLVLLETRESSRSNSGKQTSFSYVKIA